MKKVEKVNQVKKSEKSEALLAHLVDQIDKWKQRTADAEEYSENFKIGYVLACNDIKRALLREQKQ